MKNKRNPFLQVSVHVFSVNEIFDKISQLNCRKTENRVILMNICSFSEWIFKLRFNQFTTWLVIIVKCENSIDFFVKKLTRQKGTDEKWKNFIQLFPNFNEEWKIVNQVFRILSKILCAWNVWNFLIQDFTWIRKNEEFYWKYVNQAACFDWHLDINTCFYLPIFFWKDRFSG